MNGQNIKAIFFSVVKTLRIGHGVCVPGQNVWTPALTFLFSIFRPESVLKFLTNQNVFFLFFLLFVRLICKTGLCGPGDLLQRFSSEDNESSERPCGSIWKGTPKGWQLVRSPPECLALSGGQLYKFLTEVSYRQRLLGTGHSTSALISYWYALLDLVYLFDYSTCTHTSNWPSLDLKS